jgi:hypothetical protein
MRFREGVGVQRKLEAVMRCAFCVILRMVRAISPNMSPSRLGMDPTPTDLALCLMRESGSQVFLPKTLLYIS